MDHLSWYLESYKFCNTRPSLQETEYKYWFWEETWQTKQIGIWENAVLNKLS